MMGSGWRLGEVVGEVSIWKVFVSCKFVGVTLGVTAVSVLVVDASASMTWFAVFSKRHANVCK